MSDYTGLTFAEIAGLDFIRFLAYRRDAYITMLEKTQAGQEYLDNAWRMEQTKPDRAALRKKLRKEGADGK